MSGFFENYGFLIVTIVQQALLGLNLALQLVCHAVKTFAQVVQLIISFAHAIADSLGQITVTDCLECFFESPYRARNVGSKTRRCQKAEQEARGNMR